MTFPDLNFLVELLQDRDVVFCLMMGAFLFVVFLAAIEDWIG